HPQNGQPAPAHASDFFNICRRHDDAQRRAALFFGWLDERRNSARHSALAEVAGALLSDFGRRHPDRALHDAANHLRLFWETTRGFRTCARKPARYDNAADCAGVLRNFLHRRADACLAVAARLPHGRSGAALWYRVGCAFGGSGQLLGSFTTDLDERGISAGVDETTIGTRRIGRVVSGWHSGQIQTYLGAVAIGMLALLLLYAWLA